MRGPGDGDAALEVVEPLIARALGLQGPDGSLPALVGERPGGVRADVLAQALRIGAILRARRRLAGDACGARLDALAAALLAHVRPDGGVLFSQEQPAGRATTLLV